MGLERLTPAERIALDVERIALQLDRLLFDRAADLDRLDAGHGYVRAAIRGARGRLAGVALGLAPDAVNQSALGALDLRCRGCRKALDQGERLEGDGRCSPCQARAARRA